MDYVHLDYWTYNASQLKFYLVSPGPRETPYVIDVVKQDWQKSGHSAEYFFRCRFIQHISIKGGR